MASHAVGLNAAQRSSVVKKISIKSCVGVHPDVRPLTGVGDRSFLLRSILRFDIENEIEKISRLEAAGSNDLSIFANLGT